MTTDAIAPSGSGTAAGALAGGTATTTTAKPKEASKLGQLNGDDFLKLLVAQLKYQDPMKPADSTAFVAQSATFTMVQQMSDMAKQSASVLAGQQTQTASALIGRTITYLDKATDRDTTGIVTGAVFGGTDGPIIKMGDKEVPMSAIKGVTAVAAAPAPTPTPAPNPASDS